MARPGQFRNHETTLLKIWIRPAVCPKSCKLECKREHKKSTTVLLSWSTNPTTNSKIQHKKKHKLEHKKTQEKHNCFATQSTNPTTNSKIQHKKSTTVLRFGAQGKAQTGRILPIYSRTHDCFLKMIKRYKAWGGPEWPGNPGRRWEALRVPRRPPMPMPIIMSMYCHCRRCSCMPVSV